MSLGYSESGSRIEISTPSYDFVPLSGKNFEMEKNRPDYLEFGTLRPARGSINLFNES